MSEDNSVLGCWVEVELHVEEGHMKANGRIRCVIMRVEGRNTFKTGLSSSKSPFSASKPSIGSGFVS